MLFSIVTPSYRNSNWLKLCVASVADQGVALEHLVQDAGSDDGTLEWLPGDQRVKAFVENDQGMYDAINRGLRRARGDLLAYLNCDEQYLPGALRLAADYFDQNPEVDVLFGDIVMVDPHGGYLCHRKVQVPLKYHTWVSHLSTLSCAMFFRRKIVAERGVYFDPQWRTSGDAEWVLRLHEHRVPMAALGRFTSAFTCTGANMGQAANARRETRALCQTAPAWARGMKPLLVLHHRLRRLWGGMYFQKPFDYAVFTQRSPAQRERFEVRHPTFRRPPGR
jgi:glycosyltransferase involved in cell wall biosynthesis